MEAKDLQKFLDDFEERKLDPFLRSAPIPKKQTH
jgi:hypothetical protein